MFVKRFLNSKRDKKAIVTQLVLPLLMVVFGLLLITTVPARENDPPRVLKLSNLSVDGVHTKAFFADFRNKSEDAKLQTFEVVMPVVSYSKFHPFFLRLNLVFTISGQESTFLYGRVRYCWINNHFQLITQRLGFRGDDFHICS